MNQIRPTTLMLTQSCPSGVSVQKSYNRNREKAENWLEGQFEDRGPYTQVYLDEETAVVIAQKVQLEDLTIAEVARQAIRRGLGLDD
jgi:hypothetical protein